jgi:hypothetical protein
MVMWTRLLTCMCRLHAEGRPTNRYGTKSLLQFTSTVEIRKHDFQVGILVFQEIANYHDLWSVDHITSGSFVLLQEEKDYTIQPLTPFLLVGYLKTLSASTLHSLGWQKGYGRLGRSRHVSKWGIMLTSASGNWETMPLRNNTFNMQYLKRNSMYSHKL